MRTRLSLLAAAALLAAGCFRPHAGPTTGPTMGPGAEPTSTGAGELQLVPLLSGTNPIRGGLHAAGGGRAAWSGSCADDAALWFCARDRWLVGENRSRRIVSPTTDPNRLVTGADLGITARFGPDRRTLIYLGDSVGRQALRGCDAARPRNDCNDAILVVDSADRDPDDGVAASVAAFAGPFGRVQGFLPQLLPGINGADPLPACTPAAGSGGAPCLGPFNVPTGAAAVRLPRALVPGAAAGEAGEVDALLLFYATAITVPARASWLAVSTDGFRFEKLFDRPFSRSRFIQVAPLALAAGDVAALCAVSPDSPLCDREFDLRGGAVLLFGAGETYREGRLYLAALRTIDLAVRYYRLDPGAARESWVEDEASATPVVADANPVLERFGELAVARVPAAACPAEARGRCADTLVLLANQNGLVRYRTAPLVAPGRGWSASRITSGRGYGPYVLDAFTRVAPSAGGGLELVMYHLLSAWNGRPANAPDRAPYGVFTRRLQLIDEATCREGEGRIPVCAEAPPPWPPAP